MQAVILSLGLLVAASCNQSDIFYKISNETKPIPPLIPGTPTNMVVVKRMYNDVAVSIMYVASDKLHWYAKEENENPKWDLKKYSIKQPGGKIISLAVDKNDRLYALCINSDGMDTSLRYIERNETGWKIISPAAGNIQSIHVDPDTDRLFAGVRRGNTYEIFYLEPNADISGNLSLKKLHLIPESLLEPKKAYIYAGSPFKYYGNMWQEMVQDETTKANEADDIFIIWKGEHASHPADPQTNWVYYNNTDKTSYIYNGTEWQKLDKDGEIGQQGLKSDTGTDSVSITWKGELTIPPGSPHVNWVFFNFGSELELGSILSGTVYRDGIHYLCTIGHGIYTVNEDDILANNSNALSAMRLEELLITHPASTNKRSSPRNNRIFMGMIKLKNETIIAIERSGGALYEVNPGSFEQIPCLGDNDWMKTNRYATGALVLWENATWKALIAGIQGGLSSSTNSSSSYTHGYVEFALKDDGSLDKSTPCRKVSEMKSADTNQYTTSLGKHPVNHLFQTPKEIDERMIFFASTQTAGLWSYKERKDKKLQWNAEN